MALQRLRGTQGVIPINIIFTIILVFMVRGDRGTDSLGMDATPSEVSVPHPHHPPFLRQMSFPVATLPIHPGLHTQWLGQVPQQWNVFCIIDGVISTLTVSQEATRETVSQQ